MSIWFTSKFEVFGAIRAVLGGLRAEKPVKRPVFVPPGVSERPPSGTLLFLSSLLFISPLFFSSLLSSFQLSSLFFTSPLFFSLPWPFALFAFRPLLSPLQTVMILVHTKCHCTCTSTTQFNAYAYMLASITTSSHTQELEP